MSLNRIVFSFLALVSLCACHDSNKEIPELRGEGSLMMMLLPEPLYACNDLVDNVIQQLTDVSVRMGISLNIVSPMSGEYESKLKELLSENYPYAEGNALLVTMDNSMRLSLYETNDIGLFQVREKHRVELYGVGYLTGLCMGLIDINSLVLQSEGMESDNYRYGDGFRVGFRMMSPKSVADVRVGQYEDLSELYQLAFEGNWDAVITNYGVAAPWNGEVYFDYEVDYGYGRLIEEYLDSWIQFKPRNNAPDEVIGLKSGYIQFYLNNEDLLSELIEVHWEEAVKLEEQYVTPFINVE